MRALLSALHHPERELKVVHIAGTNGKGMTAAMVARLLGVSGQQVGLYTSPHLVELRERIVLEGAPIKPEDFAEIGNEVLEAAQVIEPHTELSYFDLLTAMGLLAFHRHSMQWAVLEVGLGGLSDATNTTGKELAIVTRLGMDHMNVLGEDPWGIAEQKLGIVRRGVPTVLARQRPDMRTFLVRRLREMESPLVACQPLLEITEENPSHGIRATWPDGTSIVLDGPWPAMTPARMDCATTALAAAETLLGDATESARRLRLRTALETLVPGRLEIREGVGIVGYDAPPITRAVLDGGHNAEALAMLVDQLKRWQVSGYTLVFGMQADKMVPQVHDPLRGLFGGAGRILLPEPQTPRSPTSEQLRDFILAVQRRAPSVPIETCPDTRAALIRAAEEPRRPLVVTGSFWMLGSLMAQLESPIPPTP